MYSLLHYLVKHEIRIPVRPLSGPNNGQLEWHRPCRGSLLTMLHHPVNAGAYRYGHRPTDMRKRVPGRRSTGRHRAVIGFCLGGFSGILVLFLPKGYLLPPSDNIYS